MGTPLKPLITGGGQEFGLGAGTENTPGIVGFAKAVQLVAKEKSSDYQSNLIRLRNKLIDGLLKRIPESRLNGRRDNLSPAHANLSFINAEGESILLYLDNLGIAVSTGSACTSRSLEPSHVLTAMGLRPEEAHGSIRFSLGRQTTEDDIDRVLEVLPGIVAKLREMSPYK
jgi:cysteine desulfurase